MAFSGLTWKIKYHLGQNASLKQLIFWVWKPSFAAEHKKRDNLAMSSKVQVSLLRLVQNQRIKSTISEKQVNWKQTTLCFLGFQNSGFQIRVQNGFRNNPTFEYPKKAIFWFTLTGPLSVISTLWRTAFFLLFMHFVQCNSFIYMSERTTTTKGGGKKARVSF